MTKQMPNFSPAGGIGTVFKDQSGTSWKYTDKGWVESGTESIVGAGNKDTFVVKPEEESIVNTLKSGGAKDIDIQNALKQKQEILAKKATESEAGGITSQDKVDTPPVETNKTNTSDPFKGKTKAQVLRDAFNNGVVDNTELEKLGKTYDLLAAPTTIETPDISALTPEQKKVVVEQTKKLALEKTKGLATPTQKDEVIGTLSTFETGKDIVGMLESEKVKTGLIRGAVRSGVFGVGARKLGKTTEEEDYFNALVETFAANFRKAMSGTAVSAPEMKRLEQFLPSESKTKQDNIQGIRALSDYLGDKTSMVLGMDLANLKPQESTSDPLNISKGKDPKNNPLGI